MPGNLVFSTYSTSLVLPLILYNLPLDACLLLIRDEGMDMRKPLG